VARVVNYMASRLQPMRSHLLAVVPALLIPAMAHADVDVSLRAGAGSVDLAASSDTPFVGDRFDEVVEVYNGAATAYNRAHGYGASSPRRAPAEDHGALDLDETLVTLAPGLDISASYYRGRFELPIGLGDDMRTVGLGLYPLGVAFARDGSSVVPFALAGSIVSYVTDGSRTGGLFEVRLAAGVRIGQRITIELGVRPYAAGGTVDQERIDTLMETYDPRGSEPPPAPGEVVRGGTGAGAFDLAIGVSL
jgi:hypothetical protein